MLRSLKSLLGRRPHEPEDEARREDALPRPERATYVVGDIHGRSDLLELMLDLVDAHIGGTGNADPQLVFVGDYVDHGAESAKVLARVRELTTEFPDNVTCLMGCHERMLLDFLDDPALRGPRWLRNGGGSTLQSFGLPTEHLDAAAPPDAFRDTAERLIAVLTQDGRDWLAARPLSWLSGNLCVVHAGADPQRDIADQSSRVMLWGHPEFDSTPRTDGIWVAHGHTEIETPTVVDGRISIDTAAWSSGRLTACAIRPNGHYDFLQT